MKVSYIDEKEMSKVFGVSLEMIASPVYGCFELIDDKERSIYVLNNLSIKGKIIVLFHELFHWASSYFPACTDRLDAVWDKDFDWVWNGASKYFK